jgi:hypothetical protein
MDSERRRARRRIVNWPGRYWLSDDPRSDVRPCRIIDVSETGVGVEIFGGLPEDPVGRLLAVHVPGPEGGSMGFHIEGVIRDVQPGHAGSVRLGIAFTAAKLA